MQMTTNTTQQNTQESPYKYSNQLVCIKRDDLNLYANVIMKLPTVQELREGKYPGMDVFGATRFDLYLFKYDDKKSVKFSLSPKDIFCIQLKSQALIQHIMTAEKKAQDNLSCGYTVTLKGGSFSGKTAAGILLENPAMRNDLLKQRDYYAQNANHPKYGKNNVAMMNAINDAVVLLDAGKLDSSKILSGVKTIYESIKTPDNKKLDNRGLTKARHCTIRYSENSAMPFSIQIMNCMAPPVDAKVGAKLEQSQDKTVMNINATNEEWLFFINEMADFLNEIRSMTLRNRMTVYNTTPFLQ